MVLKPRFNKILTFLILPTAFVGFWLIGYDFCPLPWRTLVNSVVPLLFVVLLYQDKFLKKLFYYALTLVLEVAGELLATTIIQFIFQIRADQVTELAYKGIVVIVYLIVLLILYIITIIILHKKILQLTRWEWLVYSLFIISEVALICLMLNFVLVKSSSGSSVYILFSIVAVFLCFCLIYALHETSVKNTLALKNEVLQNSVKIQYQYYLDLKKQMEDTSKYRHDIYNHIQAVKSLMDSGRTDEAMHYFSDMQTKFSQIDQSFHSGNPVIEAILSSKYSQIRERNIDFQYEFDLNEKINIPEIDLVSVLSNLIDNAIEAASLSSEKKITLTCYTKAGMLVFKVDNAYDDGKSTAVLKNPMYQHGLGMEIVDETCKKYDGNFHTEKTPEIITSVACLNVC